MAYQTDNRSALSAIKSREITKAMQALMGICSGITADRNINELEVQFLNTWLASNPETASSWPGSVIAERVQAIMADGVITADERLDLLETIQSMGGHDFENTGSAGPDFPIMPIDDDPCIFFKNMSFCFTGRFVYGTRAACERAILCLGGMAQDTISRRLDYLVIGTMVETQWVNTTYGRKIEAAMQQKLNGSEISIVSEQQWVEAIKDASR